MPPRRADRDAPPVVDVAARTRRWTRKEYDRLVELGVLHEDEPIELVYREPARSPAAHDGWKYTRPRMLKPGATVSPLAAPAARIAVADLLP